MEAVTALRAEVERLAAQAAPTDEAMWDQTLKERDTYHDWADKLAEGIAAHLGIDIGEHTAGMGSAESNNPWANALEAIQAVAQSAPLAQQAAREYPPLPEPKLARVRCDQCEGSGFLRVSPDPERSDEVCSACRGRGWSSVWSGPPRYCWPKSNASTAQLAQRSNHATDQRRT